MNNISFTGGFLLKRPTDETLWKQIQAELPSSKCIIEDFNEYGDKFFAIKSIYDRAMASVLMREKVQFRMYPDINLKSRLDPRNPEKARKIINAQTNLIEDEDELRQFIRTGGPKVLIEKYRWTPEDHVDKTYKALGLNKSDYITSKKDGITYIKDKSGKVVAMVSPNNNRGVNFVCVCSKTDNLDPSLEQFALDQNGNKRYFGPLQIKDFRKNFMQNVKIDLGRKRPQKTEKI